MHNTQKTTPSTTTIDISTGGGSACLVFLPVASPTVPLCSLQGHQPGPPFINVSLHHHRNISRWRSHGRDVSLPCPAACLGSFFSPRLVLPSEPEPEAPLLSLLSKVMESLFPVGVCDSEGFQEPLCGCPDEASTPDLHWEG